MLRLFIALDLPLPVRSRLALLQAGVPGARWVRPENLHLTLRFLGEVDDGIARDLDIELGRIQAAGFELMVDGVGHFGPQRSPQVLWAGIARSEALQFLHDKVDRAAVAAGLAADDRKFRPHVTLAHLRGAHGPRVGRWLADYAVVQAGPIPVGGFVLYRSHLHNEGSIYEPLAEYPLAVA
jgi:2'-5' RNA ligase